MSKVYHAAFEPWSAACTEKLPFVPPLWPIPQSQIYKSWHNFVAQSVIFMKIEIKIK